MTYTIAYVMLSNCVTFLLLLIMASCYHAYPKLVKKLAIHCSNINISMAVSHYLSLLVTRRSTCWFHSPIINNRSEYQQII